MFAYITSRISLSVILRRNLEQHNNIVATAAYDSFTVSSKINRTSELTSRHITYLEEHSVKWSRYRIFVLNEYNVLDVTG